MCACPWDRRPQGWGNSQWFTMWSPVPEVGVYHCAVSILWSIQPMRGALLTDAPWEFCGGSANGEFPAFDLDALGRTSLFKGARYRCCILDLKGKDCASPTIQPWFQAIPTFRFKGSKHAKMIRRTASNKTPMTLKQCISMLYLVVWNMARLFSIWDVILPIDELHHFSRWLKHVETTNQIGYIYPSPIWYHAEMTPLEATPQQFIPFPDLELGIQPALLSAQAPSQMLIIIHWIILNHIAAKNLLSAEAMSSPGSRELKAGTQWLHMWSCGGDIFYSCESLNSLAQSGMSGWPRCDFHPSAGKPWASKKRGYHGCYSSS